MKNNLKSVEDAVLKIYKKENPSVYFSNKSKKDFENHKTKREHLYRDLLHFPIEMFDGRTILDFGAGTGENSVQFANWGEGRLLLWTLIMKRVKKLENYLINLQKMPENMKL